MKIIDLQQYRAAREITRLEEKVGQLVLNSKVGMVREMKQTFKDWLRQTNNG